MKQARCATVISAPTNLQQEERTMEYDELVAYYRERLLERYRESLERPELQQIREKLQEADAETLREVLKMLEKK